MPKGVSSLEMCGGKLGLRRYGAFFKSDLDLVLDCFQSGSTRLGTLLNCYGFRVFLPAFLLMPGEYYCAVTRIK